MNHEPTDAELAPYIEEAFEADSEVLADTLLRWLAHSDGRKDLVLIASLLTMLDSNRVALGDILSLAEEKHGLGAKWLNRRWKALSPELRQLVADLEETFLTFDDNRQTILDAARDAWIKDNPRDRTYYEQESSVAKALAKAREEAGK